MEETLIVLSNVDMHILRRWKEEDKEFKASSSSSEFEVSMIHMRYHLKTKQQNQTVQPSKTCLQTFPGAQRIKTKAIKQCRRQTQTRTPPSPLLL